MRKGLFFLLLVGGFSACVSYQFDQSPEEGLHYSPPYSSKAEIYQFDRSLPARDIILFPEEYAYISEPVVPWLKGYMELRCLDGAIINYRAYSTNTGSQELPPSSLEYLVSALDTSYQPQSTVEQFTVHNHYLEYQPFIYLEDINRREYLDQIRVQVQKEGQLERSFQINFDWNGQLSVEGDSIIPQDFKALMLQPWFFLLQSNPDWQTAERLISGWPQRRFYKEGRKNLFIPSRDRDAYTLSSPGFNAQIELHRRPQGLPLLRGFLVKGRWNAVDQEIFMGALLEQSFELEEGQRYTFRYSYKKADQIPAEWIVRP